MLAHILSSRLLACAAIASFAVGCSGVPAPTSGQRVCRVHLTPLITVAGFEAPHRVIVDPGEIEAQALSRYPHFIQSGESLHRSADNPVPTKITYCPHCEAAVKRIPGLKRI